MGNTCLQIGEEYSRTTEQELHQAMHRPEIFMTLSRESMASSMIHGPTCNLSSVQLMSLSFTVIRASLATVAAHSSLEQPANLSYNIAS